MRTIANIATQPSRINTLLQMLQTIRGQFDFINVYCNDFKELPALDGCCVMHVEGLADNAKFCGLGVVQVGDMYFTLDDDIIYPRNYVAQTLANLQVHKHKVVTYHGRKLEGKELPYYTSHKAHLYSGRTLQDEVIDVAGTGCMAFEVTNYFKPDFLATDKRKKMSDLIFSEYCAKVGKQIVACIKDYGWLKSLKPDAGIQTEFMGKETPAQNKIADNIYVMNYGYPKN